MGVQLRVKRLIFFLGLTKSVDVLTRLHHPDAPRLNREALDYLACIKRALRESTIISPVTRLRDGSSVPCTPPYVGLRGFSTDVGDANDPDFRWAYGYDCTDGPLQLFTGNVLDCHDPVITWILNCLEDRFFLFSPWPSQINMLDAGFDWFNMGGFDKLQPYYVHCAEAYLWRDEISNFLRSFFNTLAAICDPMTLSFREELDYSGGQPDKTHEEAWFFHQIRCMLLMEYNGDLILARGIPRSWLEHGKKVSIKNAPSYFGQVSFVIKSHANDHRIDATVSMPDRLTHGNAFLRLRHPDNTPILRVEINDQPWIHFDVKKEWVKLPDEIREYRVTAFY